MSKLNEYTGLREIIKNIGFLTENESDDFTTGMYNFILYNYGNKTQAPILSGNLTPAEIAGIINSMYSGMWEKVKEMDTAETPVTNYTEKEQTDNTIYGYNSDTGVKDYTTIKTFTKQHGDIYTIFTNAIDYFHNNNYYSIIVSCIVHELTLPIYESEV